MKRNPLKLLTCSELLLGISGIDVRELFEICNTAVFCSGEPVPLAGNIWWVESIRSDFIRPGGTFGTFMMYIIPIP